MFVVPPDAGLRVVLCRVRGGGSYGIGMHGLSSLHHTLKIIIVLVIFHIHRSYLGEGVLLYRLRLPRLKKHQDTGQQRILHACPFDQKPCVCNNLGIDAVL